MKFLVVIALLALATSQYCKPENGFPVTPAGEFAYTLCADDEYGYRASFCSFSAEPIWVATEDICTPQHKLVHPPFGSNMMKWQFEMTGFSEDSFLPKHNYALDVALFNLTFEYEVDPIDVVVTKVENVANKSDTVLVSVLERVDFVYRNEVIQRIKNITSDDSLLQRLSELNDDFRPCTITLIEDSFHWNSWNIFTNFYWDALFCLIIISVIWYYLCKCGRKQCAKKAAEKEQKTRLVTV